MTQYTFQLVTYVPFTSTVIVEADNEDAAFDKVYENVNSDLSTWERDEDFVIDAEQVDVEDYSPQDEEDDDSDEEVDESTETK